MDDKEHRDEFIAELQKTEKAKRAIKAPAVVEGNTAGYSPVVGAASAMKAKWLIRLQGHGDAALGVVRADGDYGLQIHANSDIWAFWMSSRLQVSGGVGSSSRTQGPDTLRYPADVELHLDVVLGTLTVRAHGAIFGFMETISTHAPMRLVVGTGHQQCKVTLLSFVDLEQQAVGLGDPIFAREPSQSLMRGYGATAEELQRQIDELRTSLWIERRGRERAEEELRRCKEEDSHVAPLQLGGLFNPLLSMGAKRPSLDLDSSPGARANRRGSTGSLPQSATINY